MLLDNEAGTVTEWSKSGEKVSRSALDGAERQTDPANLAARGMPKSVDVEDFAAKLALLTKRLNWSRAKLAQQVGVDKSLAARWLNGNSRPTGNSLMQLTTAVAQVDRRLHRGRLGPHTRSSSRAASGSSRGAAIRAAAAGRRTRLTLSGLRNPPPAATWGGAYVGLWAGFYQSFTNRGVVRLCAAEFAIDDGGLRFAYHGRIFRLRRSGDRDPEAPSRDLRVRRRSTIT